MILICGAAGSSHSSLVFEFEDKQGQLFLASNIANKFVGYLRS